LTREIIKIKTTFTEEEKTDQNRAAQPDKDIGQIDSQTSKKSPFSFV